MIDHCPNCGHDFGTEYFQQNDTMAPAVPVSQPGEISIDEIWAANLMEVSLDNSMGPGVIELAVAKIDSVTIETVTSDISVREWLQDKKKHHFRLKIPQPFGGNYILTFTGKLFPEGGSLKTEDDFIRETTKIEVIGEITTFIE